MKILIIWNDIPSAYASSSATPFYFIKHSGDYNHDITLISFKHATEKLNYKYESDLQRYCNKFETIDVSKEESSFKYKIYEGRQAVRDRRSISVDKRRVK